MAPSANDEQTGDSPERILRAAPSLFAEYGYHGVSTRAIAKAVGLNVAPVSYHLLDRARQAGTIRADGPDPRLFLIGSTWMLYGYFAGEPIPLNADSFEPGQIAALRAFLPTYICRLLGCRREKGIGMLSRKPSCGFRVPIAAVAPFSKNAKGE